MSGETQQTPADEFWITLLWKRVRAELLARPLFYLATFVSIVMLAGLFYWPINITRNGKLTDLEQFLFQLFLVALPAGISWALAKRKEEQYVLTKQKALASSAVRRISSISAAASRLTDIIEARKAAVMSGTEWVEMDAVRKKLFYELFDGLSKQVVEMRDNIAASEDDWRDILPEEFAKKAAAEREILKERELAIKEMEKAYAELRGALEKGEARTSEQIAALNSLIAKQIQSVEQRLSIKVEQIRAQSLSPVVSTVSALAALPNLLNESNPWLAMARTPTEPFINTLFAVTPTASQSQGETATVPRPPVLPSRKLARDVKAALEEKKKEEEVKANPASEKEKND